MMSHELRQIEHGDLLLPVNDRPQLCIRIDHAPILGILQTVLFNIGPEPFSDLGAWQRRTANDGSQLRARLYFLEQRPILRRSLRSRRAPAACDSSQRRRDCHCLQAPQYSVTPWGARSWYAPRNW